MGHLAQKPGADRSKLFLLFIGPCMGFFALALEVIISYSAGSATKWSQAGQWFAACYAIGLTVSLFLERNYPPGGDNENRLPEIFISLLGFVVSVVFLLAFANSRALMDLRIGSYNAIAAGTFMVRRRTDRIRALTFGLLAIVAIHSPLVTTRPPFISLSIFWAVLGVSCVVGTNVSNNTVRRAFSVPVLACALCTAFGAYELLVAYRTKSLAGLVIGTITVGFFGVGTAIVMIRGSWWERRAKHH